MKVVYLSHFINNNTPLYGGNKNISIKKDKCISKRDSCNTLFLSFPNHTSTHIDCPYHFIENGKKLNDYSPEFWIFNKVFLIDLGNIQENEIIGISHIEDKLENSNSIQILLIKTNFERFRTNEKYWKNSPGLAPELAKFLKEKFPKLKAIGIDFISISSLKNRELGRKAHKEFLKREILLIEDMKLKDIALAPDKIIGLPLLIEKADGAPVTVIGIFN